ncbi:MAG: biotin-dependent carboxyltransferase family protein, partial [Janthinobacterium lividum]
MTLLRIVAPGGGATLQDLGRPGYARFGVAEAGAMDGAALRLANRLVGNGEDEACIEFALAGGHYEVVDGTCRIAVAGGDFDVTVRGASPGSYRAIDLAPGDRLAIGPARSGLYGYLAVSGGFAVAPVLGSRSVHLRSGIGGTALAAGGSLPLRRNSAPEGAPLGLDRPLWPTSTGPIRIV